MKTVTITEFRKHASGLISEVERGETLLVMRHGRAVAEISPVGESSKIEPAWKQPGLRLAGGKAALSTAILEDRECGH